MSWLVCLSQLRSKGWQATVAWQHRCYGSLARNATPSAVLSARSAVLRRPSSPFRLPSSQAIRTKATTKMPLVPVVTTLQQLQQLRDMIERLNKTNKPEEKKAIIRDYRDLEELLIYMSDVEIRFHISPVSFTKYLEKPNRKSELTDEDLALIDKFDLVDMLDYVSKRLVTGSRAKCMLAEFLRRADVETTKESSSDELDVMTVFMRVLDRNLKAGIMSKTIIDAFNEASREPRGPASTEETLNPSGNSFERALDRNRDEVSNARQSQRFDFRRTRKGGSSASSSPFDVALGKTQELVDVEALFEPSSKWNSPPNPSGSPSWFMSRKLDGMRCILEITVACNEYGRPLETISVRALTRANREILTLTKLTEGVAKWVCESTVVGELLKSELAKKHVLSEEHSRIAQIFLDGEICVLVPNANADGVSAVQDTTEASDGGQRYVEDFQLISKEWRRANHTIETPAYFPFDLLPYDEFKRWTRAKRVHDTLATRLERVASLVKEFQQLQRKAEQDEGREAAPLIVRRLEQRRVSDARQIREEFVKSGEQNWEGLILRRDCQYEGKRTNAVRKLKTMIDDEYVVTDVEVTTMRLAVGKEFAERRAVASVLINHKGTVVNVGSGFTVEQRLRYAENPELIIGKQITVRYFEETRSEARKGEGELSLRFPSVKAVYENGKRDD